MYQPRQEYAWQTQAAATPPPPPEVVEPSEPKVKKKKARANIVYSQPADTGTGQNINTQLVYAVDYLKSHTGPMRVQDLAIITNTPLDTDPVLLQRFRDHDRIVCLPGNKDLFEYKHDFNVRNKAQLLTEIQRSTQTGRGVAIKKIKESWKDATTSIEEMEKDGDVLVIRNGKDAHMKSVFWNEIKPDEESGGAQVEQEFRDLWHGLTVPVETDLLKALDSVGLQATSTEAVVPKAGAGKKKGKKGAPKHRSIKLTNTHLNGVVDLSRDFVPPGKS